MVRDRGPNSLILPLWSSWVRGSRYGGFPEAGLLIYMPVLLVTLGTYGVLTRMFGPKPSGLGETRSRKCNYILCGISEPRCPECGERI
jgi:hypothetical protein